MSVFVDEKMSAEIEANAKARPRYSTDVITTDGGHEVRNSRWAYPLHKFEFNVEPGSRDGDDALAALEEMYHVCGGQYGAFRFHYWRDVPVVGQIIGFGDGTTTGFQLIRSYIRGSLTRDRKITRPVDGTVVVYVEGIETAASVDYSTGLVTISPAPASSTVVTADFEHDVPVRFADDEIEVVGMTDVLDQIVSITLLEIRE